MSRPAAESYAHAVWERFCNPWLDHVWSVIASNQSEKMRIRVIPSIVGFYEQCARVPQGLALALAAHLSFLDMPQRALNEDALWGTTLGAIPGFVEATTRWLAALEKDGVARAIDELLGIATA